MGSENYLPQRAVDPSMYVQQTVNPNAMPLATSAQQYQGQAPMMMPPASPAYPMPQAQVGQWQAQQVTPAPQASASVYPQNRVRYVEDKATQNQNAIVNNTTLGGLAAATVATGLALPQELVPPESDLSKIHTSKVDGSTYQVQLEEDANGFSRKFGKDKDAKIVQVKTIMQDEHRLHIHYDGQGNPQRIERELGGGVKAYYKPDKKGVFAFEEVIVETQKGQTSRFGPKELQNLGTFDPKVLRKKEQELATLERPKGGFLGMGRSPQAEWDTYNTDSKSLNNQIKKLRIQEAKHNALGDLVDKAGNWSKGTIDLPDLEKVVSNVHINSYVEYGDVAKKMLTKAGLWGAIGAIGLGGGTWAFQTVTEKNAQQKQIEAKLAQAEANPPQAPQMQAMQSMRPMNPYMQPGMNQGMVPPM